jgi:hypothetical protein
MPRVINHNDACQALYNEALMAEFDIEHPGVRFADTGTSQEIPADLAERLVEHYDTIEPYDNQE